MRKAIHQYLGTPQGIMEINHIIFEIELMEAPAPGDDPNLPMDEKTNQKKRKNVREIFRKYDEDGSFSIDRCVWGRCRYYYYYYY
jgi:hypothetical protein